MGSTGSSLSSGSMISPHCLAVPQREGHAVITLARDAPIPVQVFHPGAVACLHMLGVPVHLFTSRQQLVFEIQHADEPLRCHDVFHGRVAALVHADRLLRGLAVQDQPLRLQVCLDLAARLSDGQSGVVAGRRRSCARRGQSPRSAAGCGCSHQATSAVSPKVQHITAPVPFSGSAAGSSSIGTSCPKSGTVALAPEQVSVACISGWTKIATHAGSSSGRVVAIGRTAVCRPALPGRPKGRVTNSLSRSRSFSSAWAIDVRHSGHQMAGASRR